MIKYRVQYLLNVFLMSIHWVIDGLGISNYFIPFGISYCYIGLKFHYERGVYYIKLCPFYLINNKISKCVIAWSRKDDYLLDDQCKICGINEQ